MGPARTARAILALTALTALGTPALVAAADPAPSARSLSLTGEIEEAWMSGGLGESLGSVHVLETGSAATGGVVEMIAHWRSEPEPKDEQPWMIPASNMKLLTTGTALIVLGADFRFRTELRLDGDRLIVVGDGDPAFADPELLSRMGPDGRGLDPDQFLRYWIDAVVEHGVTHLSRVVVDDRVFDHNFTHPDWPRDQLNRRYCAQVSGLSFHLNVMHFYPQPTPGYLPNWEIFQPRYEWIEGRNESETGTGEGESNTAWIARRLIDSADTDENQLTFFGTVRHPYRSNFVPVTVHNVPALFAHLLMIELQDAGVAVDGYGVLPFDEPPAHGERIGPPIFTPIDLAVQRCNRDSENLYAEAMIKRIGHARSGQPGSWTNGAAAIRQTMLACLNAPELMDEVRVADGSGLSRNNRVSPRTMAHWLAWFAAAEELGDPIGTAFLASLPRAADPDDSGTLRKRMSWLRQTEFRDVVVQAKTGYINGVSCLSGYVTYTPSDGPRLRRCFSIMVNDLNVAVWKAKAFQDKAVRLIAEDLLDRAALMADGARALGGD